MTIKTGSVTASFEDEELVIRVNLGTAKLSSTGKSYVNFTTGGFISLDSVGAKPPMPNMQILLNVITPKADYLRSKRGS